MADRPVDLRREYPALYAPRNRDWQAVEVPPLTYLMIDGAGDPNTDPAYASALAALYPAAYAVRSASMRLLGRPFVVSSLEGLWHADDPTVFVRRDKAAFSWTMMIRQPEWVSFEIITEALATAQTQRPTAGIDRVRLESLHERRSLQVLHIGSYDDEGPLLHRLHHDLMPAAGLTFAGHHHEVYLGDPRRAAPERLRTVLRQPVRPAVSIESG